MEPLKVYWVLLGEDPLSRGGSTKHPASRHPSTEISLFGSVASPKEAGATLPEGEGSPQS